MRRKWVNMTHQSIITGAITNAYTLDEWGFDSPNTSTFALQTLHVCSQTAQNRALLAKETRMIMSLLQSSCMLFSINFATATYSEQ